MPAPAGHSVPPEGKLWRLGIARRSRGRDVLSTGGCPRSPVCPPGKDLPLGVPGAYWLSLRDYHPDLVAAKLSLPLLVLQGERDYQVTMADFALWKKNLAAKQNAVLKSYPKLNHLFMEGEGKSKPDEYMKAGHVAREVIDDIATWIKKH